MFCLQKDGTATTYIEIITPISCIEIASCWQQENLVPLYYLALLCSLVYFVLTSIWEKFSSLLKLLRSSTKGKRLPTPLATRPSTPHESTFPQASGCLNQETARNKTGRTWRVHPSSGKDDLKKFRQIWFDKLDFYFFFLLRSVEVPYFLCQARRSFSKSSRHISFFPTHPKTLTWHQGFFAEHVQDPKRQHKGARWWQPLLAFYLSAICNRLWSWLLRSTKPISVGFTLNSLFDLTLAFTENGVCRCLKDLPPCETCTVWKHLLKMVGGAEYANGNIRKLPTRSVDIHVGARLGPCAFQYAFAFFATNDESFVFVRHFLLDVKTIMQRQTMLMPADALMPRKYTSKVDAQVFQLWIMNGWFSCT